MKPKHRIYCMDCGRPKMLFETEKKANTFIKFNGSELCDDISTLRTYYCDCCCGWHISSHKAPKKSRTSIVLERYSQDKSRCMKIAFNLYSSDSKYDRKSLQNIFQDELPQSDIDRIYNYYKQYVAR